MKSMPTGKLVTPGWVDIHTHYDGQATWDPILAPSSLRRHHRGDGELALGSHQSNQTIETF